MLVEHLLNLVSKLEAWELNSNLMLIKVQLKEKV
jgi:hypothetical protein